MGPAAGEVAGPLGGAGGVASDSSAKVGPAAGEAAGPLGGAGGPSSNSSAKVYSVPPGGAGNAACKMPRIEVLVERIVRPIASKTSASSPRSASVARRVLASLVAASGTVALKMLPMRSASASTLVLMSMRKEPLLADKGIGLV